MKCHHFYCVLVKFYGIKTTSSMVRAQKMFETIIANASYSKYAPLSQFNIGQALLKMDRKAEAAEAFDAFLVSTATDAKITASRRKPTTTSANVFYPGGNAGAITSC